MTLIELILYPLSRSVCVDLCCGNIGVTEHHLHRTKIGPVLNEVRGEGMSQQMWRHASDACFDPVFGQHRRECLSGNRSSLLAQKKRPGAFVVSQPTAHFEIFGEPLMCAL